MNEIFIDMHLVITNEKCLIWHMNITHQVITPDLEHVPEHIQQFQNITSNLIYYNQSMLNIGFYILIF
jgi:hypothetical protein